MRFPPQFLDQIRARVNLSSVVGRHVQWDRRKTNAGKGDYWACCPFHTEKSPSFHADDRKGRYYCFGCKASGDVFTFLTEKAGLSFPEAVSQMASEAGLPMPVISEEEAKREETRASLYDVMEMAAKLFQQELQSSHGARARGYLSDRDLPPDVQKEFGIGYSRDDRNWLRNELATKGVTLDQMIDTGLVVPGEEDKLPYDRFRDRVMFPIRDGRGRVVAFGGRALRPDVPAKYLNSPETIIFQKGELLYNYDKARQPAHQKAQVIVVEGYVDVIAMHRAGMPETVAPMGTALTEIQLGILWRTAPEPVLCFDGDAAGLKAAYRALDLGLQRLTPGHSLRFAFLPEGKDPDDLLRSDGPEALKAIVSAAEPLLDVFWRRALSENDRATPERKAAFERDLRQQVAGIADESVRRHYLDALRDRFDQLRSHERGYSPSTGRRGSGTARFAPRTTLSGRRLQEWEIQHPATQQLKLKAARIATSQPQEDRSSLILYGFISHPGLLHEFWDDFAALELASAELDSLRTRILDSAASEEGLEPAALKAHLTERGFGPVLDQLEELAKHMSEWFLGPSAAADDARTGLRHMVALHRKILTLRRELKAAEAALARNSSEENLQTVNAVRDQLLSAQGSEATVEGFGAQSGRGNADPV
jgi:DNA primase